MRHAVAAALLALLLAALATDTHAQATDSGEAASDAAASGDTRLGTPAGAVQLPAAPQPSASPMPVLPDLAVWEFLARRAEAALDDGRSSNLVLEQLRARLADWRGRFLEAQTASQARIDTLRAQLQALGPPPEADAPEAAEIAQRRRELVENLARLEAPVRTAEEAFRRADGLIREIDRVLRDRQAEALMRLSPSPLNPANWPAGITGAISAVQMLSGEIARALANPDRRAELGGNLPAILAYLALAAVLLLRGRHWIERLTGRLEDRVTGHGRAAGAFLLSPLQFLLPLLGLLALVEAIRATGLVGLRGEALVDALPVAGFTALAARWLAGRLFPAADTVRLPLNLSAERRREGRILTSALGLVLAAEQLRGAVFEGTEQAEAALSVQGFPLLALAGLLVVRIGQLLDLHRRAAAAEDEAAGFVARVVGLLGRLAMALGAGGVVLAAIGYMAAGAAIVFPAALSLGLIGLLILLAGLVSDLTNLVAGSPEEDRGPLLPVLVDIALVILSLPVFALLWGVRDTELLELWVRFREGVTLGEARISPGEFLRFLMVFLIGFAITRLVQGALRSSVLPKTRLDKGGQAALVSGLGYGGIFLAGVIAFTAAGIDLSSLALVAGALSLGIGFGLQTVVSNFVAGIILLFERPVAEGDWIEVGGVMGTVRKVSVRSTVIETFDRTDVIVPNADLITSMVTNWTRYNLTTRLIVKVGVAYGSDTRKVARILAEIAEEQPLVVLTPPPSVLFRSFGADALEFEIRVILRDVNFRLKVESEINHRIAERFAEEGIEIPFAQRDIWLRNPEALTGITAPRPDSANPVDPIPEAPR